MSAIVPTTSATESVTNLSLWATRHERIVEPEKLYTQHAQWQSWIVRMLEGTLLRDDWDNLILCERFQPQTSAAVTSQIEEVLNLLLQNRIVIPQPAEVRDYLLRYPDMMELLASVCEMAREQFGMDTQLSLEVYRDPEIEDEYLTLCVRQRDYDEHILDIIEDISREYEEKLALSFGWLIITTDFDPPR